MRRAYSAGDVVLTACGVHVAWTFSAMLADEHSTISLYYRPPHLVVIMLFIGMIFGGCFGGLLVNRIGRKKSSIIAAANVLGGGICFSIPFELFNHLEPYGSVLCIGRFFIGFALGLAYVSQTVYIGEIASAEERGKHLLSISAATYAGFLIHFCNLNVSVYQSRNIELMMGIITVIFGIMAGIFTFLQRESPYFLFMKGNYEEGVRNLKYFRKTEETTDAIHKEIDEIKGYLGENASTTTVAAIIDLLRNNSKTLVTCFVLKFTQAVTYNPVIMMAHLTFTMYLMLFSSNPSRDFLFPSFIILALVKMIGLIIVMYTTDRTGRRKWLLISGCGSSVCLMIMPIMSFSNGFIYTEGGQYASSVLTLVIEFFVALGFGSIPDVIVGESTTMASKPLVAAFSCVVVGLTNIIYYHVFFEGIIATSLGASFYWIIYGSSAAFIAAATIYCHFQLPETSRMTLREAKERYPSNTINYSKVQ